VRRVFYFNRYSQTNNHYRNGVGVDLWQWWPTSQWTRATFLILYYCNESHSIHRHTWIPPRAVWKAVGPPKKIQMGPF